MKKLSILALVLVLAAMLSIPTGAATVENDKATVTTQTITGANTTVVFDSSNPDIIKVTVTGSTLKAGNQYVVLMVKCADGENYTIDSDSILYIDQMAATASGSNGSVTFNVYPSSLTDSVILIAGADDGLLKVAIVDGKYILGDVTGDGKITTGDALQVLQHAVGRKTLEGQKFSAGDVTKDGKVTTGDALQVLQFAVGRISEFK